MTQQIKLDKKKQKPKNGKIVTVDCNVRLGGNSVFFEYNDVVYIASQTLTRKLLAGTLTTKDGKDSTHLKVGILEGNVVTWDTEAWLTLKGKAIYFTPEKDDILIASVDGFLKLMSGDWTWLKMGKRQV